MRQHDQRQRRLAQAAEDVVALGADVLAQRHPGARGSSPSVRAACTRETRGPAAPAWSTAPATRAGRSSRRPAARPATAGAGCAAGCRGSSSARSPAAGWRTTAPLASRTVRQIQRAICQSPRTQRCWRAANAQVVVRVVVDDVDVGAQRRARERPLEEVVAEQRVVRHAAGERPLERVDVVDALADVAALVEQILVDVGHRGRVRIDADVAREDPREPRAVGADDADRDARLENPVALGHALHRRVEARPVQRVRQRADHRPAPPRAAAACRESSVMTYFTDGSTAEIAELHGVAGVGGAAQQPVELVQLAALALPSHPAPFAGVVARARGGTGRSDPAPWRAFRASMPVCAAASSAASSGASRSAASRKSVSSAKCRC